VKHIGVRATYQPVGETMEFPPFKWFARTNYGFYHWHWLKGFHFLH